MMKKILIPLDGTAFAEQVLPTAVSLARQTHATLELMLVNEPRSAGGLERWPWAVSSARTHADYLSDRASALREATGVPVEHSVADGRSAEEICRRAESIDADLILMASRCQTGIARVLGASVADDVIRHARKPVLLIHPPPSGRRIQHATLRGARGQLQRARGAAPRPPPHGSEEARAALEAAIAIAERGVTELHLVEIVRPVKRPMYGTTRGRIDSDATARLVDHANEELEELATDIEGRTGCDTFPHVRTDDDIAHGILHLARGFNVSAIAMGSRGRGASRLFVGSVAEHVLRGGRLPLLLVRQPNEIADRSAQRRSKEA